MGSVSLRPQGSILALFLWLAFTSLGHGNGNGLVLWLTSVHFPADILADNLFAATFLQGHLSVPFG